MGDVKLYFKQRYHGDLLSVQRCCLAGSTWRCRARFSLPSHRIHVWYVYLYVYHMNQPKVGKYTIHGSSGNWMIFKGSVFILLVRCLERVPKKKTIHPEIPNGCNMINAPLWKRKLLYVNSRLSWICLFDAWKKFQQIFSPIVGLDGGFYWISSKKSFKTLWCEPYDSHDSHGSGSLNFVYYCI